MMMMMVVAKRKEEEGQRRMQKMLRPSNVGQGPAKGDSIPLFEMHDKKEANLWAKVEMSSL